MKIYFDNTIDLDYPNCKSLSKDVSNDFWLVSSGTRLKRELKQLGIEYFNISDLDEPGLYFIEVNGDPHWWAGLCATTNTPPKNVLYMLPKNITSLVREKKLRIVISADREGGGMILDNKDAFLSTFTAMKRLQFPEGSVLITQGNKKIVEQYNVWLDNTKNQKLFDVKYVNHFNRIFPDALSLPTVLDSIKNSEVKDYNSLNRTYKDHRSAHLYQIAKLGIIENGLVSGNEIRLNQLNPLKILQQSVSLDELDNTLNEYYPRFVDGDWTNTNAANSVNVDIFKNSLMSFITETKFDEDVVFLTEKVFKALAYGHPMIVLGACGTLAALRDLGYKTDWCGIDPSYNDIKDHTERFYKTHEVLMEWVELSRSEKIKRIEESMSTIEHNFSLSKERNFYHEDLVDAINISKEYFK